MQQTMSDTPKFVDMLHNVSWEDGLSDDVLRGNWILQIKIHKSLNFQKVFKANYKTFNMVIYV